MTSENAPRNNRSPHRRDVLGAIGGALVMRALGLRTASAHEGIGDTLHREHRPLARFRTSYEYDGPHQSRAENLRIAAEAIDTQSIAANGIFSFNEAVGARTLAYGYQRSIELRDHMIAEGVGGGTCQVASTLHAAALLAGLDVVDRSAHSRPPAYIRIGLDATVVYGKVDLKIRNPRPDRIVLRASANHGTLEVAVEAESPERPRVVIMSDIVEKAPFSQSLTRDERIKDGVVRVQAYGIPGYTVRRTREVSSHGAVRVDERTSHYPPVVERLAVSPSFDAARLALRNDEETHAGRVAPPRFEEEEGVHRPASLQLRPIVRLILENNE